MNELKENLVNLSIDDLFNLKKANQTSYRLNELIDLLFKDVTLIYCNDFHDQFKILTRTECTAKLSKLVRSFEIVIDNCEYIRNLELIGDLDCIFKSTNFFENYLELEFLEVFEKSEFKSKQPDAYTLKLKKLKKLLLHFYCENDEINAITLDTPSLEWLCIQSTTKITEILHPQTITTLETDVYLKDFTKLLNLKIYFLSSFTNYQGGLLDQFPNLQELHFLDGDQISISNLMNELKSSNSNLEIYQNNIKINETGLLDKCSVIFDYNLLNFYAENESRLTAKFHFIKDIQLTFDLDLIPKSFYSRFCCISHLKISHNVENYDRWCLLLSSCKKLGSIRLKTRLDQKYLDVIPQIAYTLNRLILDYEVDNLDFALNLKELTYLSVEQELPIDLFKKMIKSYNFIKILQFYFDGKQFTIEFLEDKLFISDIVTCNILIKSLDELLDDLTKYKTWNVLIKEMVNFLEIDYKRLDNLAFLIDIQPEINFCKSLNKNLF